MGMILGLLTLSDQNIQKVLSDPPLIWRALAPDDPQVYEDARKEAAGGTGLLGKLFGRRPAPASPPPDLYMVEGEGADTDLDKAWHGIHYMLTQTAYEGAAPWGLLLNGGSQVGDIDVGYGPARVLTASQVQAFAGALDAVDKSFLRERFKPQEMMKLEIYPDIWDRDPAEDDTFGYCAEYFATLKSFVGQAAQNNLGLVIYLS